MLSYETYISRHGEIGVQAIIEKLERYEGAVGNREHSLEERWKALMADRPVQHAEAA
jgi:hypothetical protein